LDESANTSKLNAKGENSFFFGNLGAALYSILVLAHSIDWIVDDKQSSGSFVYGPVAIALSIGTIHVLIMGSTQVGRTKVVAGICLRSLCRPFSPLFVMGLKVSKSSL
jgi:hypothetical protein